MAGKSFFKRTAVVITAFMAALSFAACSGNANNSSSQASTVVSSVSKTESKVSSGTVSSESSAAKGKVFDISEGTVDKNIIGLWQEINIPNKTYTFNEDNTLIINTNDRVLKRLYYLKDGKMYTSPDEYTEPEVHSYTLNGDTLRLGETEGASLNFRRSY